MWIDLILRVSLIAFLLYIAWVDFRTFLIPNRFTYPLTIGGLLLNSFSPIAWCEPHMAWIGAIMGYLILFITNQIYRTIRLQQGLGMGDAKLLASLGAWLGFSSAAWVLFLAALMGIAGGLLWLRYRKLSVEHPFPFGPFLAFAGIIQILWTSPIAQSLI